jgi:hypothetical protein
MIWINLYACFLSTTINSEVENVIVYTINNGTEEDGKRVLKEYCNDN